MVSIFDGQNVEEETEKRRELYLSRLKEISQSIESRSPNGAPGIGNLVGAQPPPAAPPEAAPLDPPAAVPEVEEQVLVELERAESAPVAQPNGNNGNNGNKSSDDVTALAGQIAPKFAEAFASVFRQIHQSETQEEQKQEAVLAAIARISAKIETLGREMGSVRQQADSGMKSAQELAAKLEVIDDRLREHERVMLGLEQQTRQVAQELKAQQDLAGERIGDTTAKVAQVGERLDSQAKAIRELHEMVRGQSQRQEELRNTLQKLGDIAGGASFTPLPDKL